MVVAFAPPSAPFKLPPLLITMFERQGLRDVGYDTAGIADPERSLLRQDPPPSVRCGAKPEGLVTIVFWVPEVWAHWDNRRWAETNGGGKCSYNTSAKRYLPACFLRPDG
ncbi:unnamed protein product, partial [Laminaria digitata]